MRYVIFGAGAIGATIGAGLACAGTEVVLIARGRQLEALGRDGLRLETPTGERRLAIPTVGSPAEAGIEAGDVVLLTMKSQDTAAALARLRAVADLRTPVVCAQNGVSNEREAERRFERVYGMFVWLAAEHLEPGVVRAFATEATGVLDLGRVPEDADRLAAKIARDLEGAGFASRVDEEIMRWKHTKLLSNLGNAVEALCGPDARADDLVEAAQGEALKCFAAAGIRPVGGAEVEARISLTGGLGTVAGRARRGGSSWQSLERGATVETEHLNGEIVRLGRLHGLATPVNEALTELALRAAADGAGPGRTAPREIEAAIAGLQ